MTLTQQVSGSTPARAEPSASSGQGTQSVSKPSEPPPPFGLSLSKPCFESATRFFGESGAALSPRRATHFSLLRQRNLRKRKATLVPASLRFAAGNLRCSVQPGSRSNSPEGSDNRGALSVWPSAPRRIHKGLGDGIGIGIGIGIGFGFGFGFGFGVRFLSCRRYYFYSCSRRYYLG